MNKQNQERDNNSLRENDFYPNLNHFGMLAPMNGPKSDKIMLKMRVLKLCFWDWIVENSIAQNFDATQTRLLATNHL